MERFSARNERVKNHSEFNERAEVGVFIRAITSLDVPERIDELKVAIADRLESFAKKIPTEKYSAMSAPYPPDAREIARRIILDQLQSVAVDNSSSIGILKALLSGSPRAHPQEVRRQA